MSRNPRLLKSVIQLLISLNCSSVNVNECILVTLVCEVHKMARCPICHFVFVGQDVLFQIASYKVFFVAFCQPSMDLEKDFTVSMCYLGQGQIYLTYPLFPQSA